MGDSKAKEKDNAFLTKKRNILPPLQTKEDNTSLTRQRNITPS